MVGTSVMWPYILVFVAFACVLLGVVALQWRMAILWDGHASRQARLIESLAMAKLALEHQAAAGYVAQAAQMGDTTTFGGGHGNQARAEEALDDDRLG